jgi:hypothetical protein
MAMQYLPDLRELDARVVMHQAVPQPHELKSFRFGRRAKREKAKK